MPLYAVAYRSEAIRSLTESDLEALLFDARAFNAHCGVTGVLLYAQQMFFQYFEGPQEAVDTVRGRIVASSKHHSIQTVFDGQIRDRLFSTWHMAFLQPSMSVYLKLADADWQEQLQSQPTVLQEAPGGVALAQAWHDAGMGDLPGAVQRARARPLR